MIEHARECMGFVVSAFAAVCFGYLYYSKFLFGPVRKTYSNRDFSKNSLTNLRLKSFMAYLIMSVVLCKAIGEPVSASSALIRGGIVGYGLCALTLATHYMWTNTDYVVMLIDGLHAVLNAGMMSVILYSCQSTVMFAVK